MISYRRFRGAGLVTTVALGLLAGCATSVERSTRADLQRVESSLADLGTVSDPPAEPPQLDGTLQTYLARAVAHSPSLRASFEDWRAATHRPRQERRLPEPTLTVAAYPLPVQTRVGPQLARLGAMQWFPWPSQLGAGAKAASLEAKAAQRRFEAHALEVAAEVAAAYWTLWEIHQRRAVLSDDVEVLAGLSEQVRVRLEVGGAKLSDLAQLNLMVARARDRVAALDQQEQIASADLIRVIGAPDGTATPVADAEPLVHDIAEPIATLTAAASEHPRTQAFATLSDASSQRVREARADRFPGFGLGVDWIITGRVDTPTPPTDDGQDAVSVALSLKIPLWGGAYRAAEDEARARGAAMRARAIAARDGLSAMVRKRAAQLRDDVRRVRVLESTLVPQAEAAFESVLSGYAAGNASVAELMMTQRELLALQDELVVARADYGMHLATLEAAVGRPVRTKGETIDG